METFYLGVGSIGGGIGPGIGAGGGVGDSPLRRSRSRAGAVVPAEDPPRARRARSKSRPRVLYAPESEILRSSGVFLLKNFSHVITSPETSMNLYFFVLFDDVNRMKRFLYLENSVAYIVTCSHKIVARSMIRIAKNERLPVCSFFARSYHRRCEFARDIILYVFEHSNARFEFTDFFLISDYTLLEVLKEEPIRITIRGLRRTFYPPIHHAPVENSPPEKKLQLDWVYPFPLRFEFVG